MLAPFAILSLLESGSALQPKQETNRINNISDS